MMGRLFVAWLFAAIIVTWDGAFAQQPTSTPLVRAPFTADATKETIMVRTDWPPSFSTPWHTHPGDEYAVVLEGSLVTQRDGEEPKIISAGQAYHQPQGVVHMAKTGDQPATTINVFVVEKGKPVLAPVQR